MIVSSWRSSTARGPRHRLDHHRFERADQHAFASGINDYGQISVSGNHAYLLTLQPSWSAAGSGQWENDSNWNFGGAGTLSGLTPKAPHDATIDPVTGTTVCGPYNNTQIRSLPLGSAGGAGSTTNGGQIQVYAGNRLQLTGAGIYSGTGTSFYEGTFHVGNSPAVASYDSNAVFDGSSNLDMDLGSNTPGDCTANDCAHCAHVDFKGDVDFYGGTLKLKPYGGFESKPGDTFDLFGFYGSHRGSFASMLLPPLGNGLSWNTASLLSSGDLSVNAVPVPNSAWLLGSALLGMVGAARLRGKQTA